MKKYIKEVVLLILQAAAFYVGPLFLVISESKTPPFSLIIASMAISGIIGLLADKKIKLVFPLATAILFAPTVFIYYDQTSLIYILWVFLFTSIGMFMGSYGSRIIANKR